MRILLAARLRHRWLPFNPIGDLGLVNKAVPGSAARTVIVSLQDKLKKEPQRPAIFDDT
jgi:hypothetical protein